MVTDNFNNPDTLATNWDILSGTAAVADGVLRITSSPFGLLTHTVPLADPNQYAQISLAPGAAIRGVGVAVRVHSDDLMGVYLTCGANGGPITLGQITDGAFGPIAAGTVTPAIGNRLRLEVRGTAAIGRLYATNGALLDSVGPIETPAVDPMALKVGLCRSGGSPGQTGMDDFEAGELPPLAFSPVASRHRTSLFRSSIVKGLP